MFSNIIFLSFTICIVTSRELYRNNILNHFERSFLGDFSNYHDGRDRLKDEWLVTLDGGPEDALELAMELGYKFGGNVMGFPNTFIFYEDDHEIKRRGHQHSAQLSKRLISSKMVHWAEQLFDKQRTKRDFFPETPLEREKRIGPFKSKENDIFNDEMWKKEWYLHDTGPYGLHPKLDLNVLPVYRMGYNGSGVRVTILDDGLEYTHEDLKDNYDPEISWDCNEGDPDPTPRYDTLKLNSHGTRCAGEVAMKANNSVCGVGVAYGASIGGVRMLDGGVNDRVEGEAIGYAWDKVDIYSSSWGPIDDGTRVEGPGRLARHALLRGVTKGRNGKGVIFVWANGNGGGSADDCNCDGYASSIYTISVASAGRKGKFPWYGERCSSTIATAYSSDKSNNNNIATTDLGNSCTFQHSGTSAAAPLAAGVIALALQANPNLTWRDVQHLIVWTAEYAPLAENEGWIMNGVGLLYNPKFGFGLLNAGKMVKRALQWKNISKQLKCTLNSDLPATGMKISSGSFVRATFVGDHCDLWLEHVELIIDIDYTRRGLLSILLTSPQGTSVTVLNQRPLDNSTNGFVQWPLVSLATWGERAGGTWTVDVFDTTGIRDHGTVKELTLNLYGTKEKPYHISNSNRKYNTDEMEMKRLYKLIGKLKDKMENKISNHDIEIKNSHTSIDELGNVIGKHMGENEIGEHKDETSEHRSKVSGYKQTDISEVINNKDVFGKSDLDGLYLTGNVLEDFEGILQRT